MDDLESLRANVERMRKVLQKFAQPPYVLALRYDDAGALWRAMRGALDGPRCTCSPPWGESPFGMKGHKPDCPLYMQSKPPKPMHVSDDV